MTRKSATLVQIVPNVVTCIGLTCGLAAIFLSLKGRFDLAAWLVLLCVLLDKLDGTAARLLNAGSELGMQLDSLSDFVTFIVAPSVLFVAVLTDENAVFAGMPNALLAYGSATVYVISGAARLARFNCVEQDGGGLTRFFEGIPTTMAGAACGTLFLVLHKYELLDRFAWALPPLLLLLGLAMVSRYYLPKMGRRRSRVVSVFQLINLVVAPVLVLTHLYPEYLLFLVVLYLTVGLAFANRKGVEIS